ncbi:MAG: FecR family protein [Bacteroidota bacterium]
MSDNAKELISKYQQGECSKKEAALIQHWYMAEFANQELANAPSNPLSEEQLIWERITKSTGITLESEKEVKVKRLFSLKWLIAAASILIAVSAGLYIFKHPSLQHEARMAALRTNDIKPGGNKAMLTLSDGSVINLSAVNDGDIANSQGSQITKMQDGQLMYSMKPSSLTEEKSLKPENYNTISTPRGGKYQIILVDGTKVWLNASSSLKFPTSFAANQRSVEVTGEAYFEVTKNEVKPFYVVTKGQTIEVLGTKFNVSAYSDEKILSTTLLEGSVKINAGKQSIIIKPGEQSVLEKDHLEIGTTNIDEAIAWKNDKFKFNNENIVSLMRKISRWYDVEVEFRGAISNEGFGGQVSRSRNISEVLEVLQLTGLVHFEISKGDANGKGRRVIVLQN